MARSKIIQIKHTKSTNIIDALVIRDQDLTMVTLPNGNIPINSNSGYGIYHRDCRFLSGYMLMLNGKRMTGILSSDQNNFEATTYLTNPDFKDRHGNFVPKESLSISRNVVIPGCVIETVTINNFNTFTVALDLSLEFESDFDDIFTVRGMTEQKGGRIKPVSHDGNTLLISYNGLDGRTRNTRVQFNRKPVKTGDRYYTFSIDLEPHTPQQIVVSIFIEDLPPKAKPARLLGADINDKLKAINKSYWEETDYIRNFQTDNRLFNRIMLRSMLDLRMMQMSLDGHTFYSAGVPWYDALFGRDSIISSLQVLPYRPNVVRDTLRLLARYQGKKYDGWRDEEPGRILHEMRVGELANLNEIPQTPYYGSADSTPLFLVVLAEYVSWTGDLELFEELLGNVDAALKWIEKSDLTGSGFVSYMTKSKSGLCNQGWKDSTESVMHHDGKLASPPVAVAEVQGYVYMAKNRVADLFERVGRDDDSSRLREEARSLKMKFNQAFWMEDKGYFAMALDSNGKCDVVSSNPAQCLWSGIIDRNYSRRMVNRIFEQDMFTGWGIRTLSSNEVCYNPLGYHVGTVWPHDNSIIASGLYQYGFYDQFSRLFTSMCEAAGAYIQYRLPELFAGFDRGEHNVPIKYPVACSPQAWSAGTVPYMLMSSLGFQPNALDRRLTLTDPYLPAWLNQVQIRGLCIGDSKVDLNFQRKAGGTLVDVEKKRGDIKVIVEY
ncbi:MAG TPA: amylo-alpha-1,6-glucosidase [Methanocella sp.]|nr:amylo-alpha-1,6-glucosidase [Methanocella sp.]